MSNLIRGKQDILLNTLTQKEVGYYLEDRGGVLTPHLVIKPYGVDILGSVATANPRNVKTTYMKFRPAVLKTLAIPFTWKWTPEAVTSTGVVFQVELLKKAMFTGETNKQFDARRSYQFRMNSFSTTTAGQLVLGDATAILTGLAAAINADVQLNPNAINQGAPVTATVSGTSLVLTAKDAYTDFEFVDRANEWGKPIVNQAYVRPAVTNDEVWRIFSIKKEQAGTRPLLPLVDTDYDKITIVATVEGYDNTVASGATNRSQAYDLYIPAGLATTSGKLTAVPTTVAGAGGTNGSMIDTGAGTVTLETWLKALGAYSTVA